MSTNSESSSPSARHCPSCGRNSAKDVLRAPDRFHGRLQFYQLVRCPSCSLVWLENPPQPNEMGDHYGRDYDRFIGAGGENSPERWIHRQQTLLRYKPTGALLDLGCSSGSFLTSLKGQSWELYGIEMSRPTAEQAEANSGAKVFVGDILEAPFERESFDVITCFDVLEHLYEPRRVIKRVSEWLKPGGIFYILVPNIESWEARLFHSYWYGLELPRHLFHYSPESLRHLGRAVGLQELSIETGRNPAFEYSVRYVYDELLQKLGRERAPLAKANKRASLPWRGVRKVFRATLLQALSNLAPLVGAGESIHAVFKKSPVLPSPHHRDTSNRK
jgi:2-polyprenyl-3-methyl-5-hydroxy-6-metoxy-1,4-benzoquinol methylase